MDTEHVIVLLLIFVVLYGVYIYSEKSRDVSQNIDVQHSAYDSNDRIESFDSVSSDSTNSSLSIESAESAKTVASERLSRSHLEDVENFESDQAPVSKALQYNEPIYDTFNAPQTDQYAGEDYYENGYASLIAEGFQDCPVETMKLFFSESNLKRIQKKIRREIYNRSYGKFRLKVDQNVLHLIIAMKAVVRLYAKFLPTKIVRQVKRLNDETVQYIVPDLMTNLKQQYSYIQDITNPLQPLPDPINVNRAGRRQLRSVTAVWDI